MKPYRLVALLGLLLLVGCSTSRPTGNETVCDCQREVRVPDKAFRTWLVNKGYAVKTHGKWLRATAAGCALTALECYNQDIHSLEGIEMFPQLEQLTCSDNPIEVLNINALPRLERLYGLNLPLRRLEMDNCCHMNHIELSYTHLDTFSLAAFPKLEFFFFIFSPLTTLDLSPCPTLKSLYIRATQIREIDLRPCPSLLELHALDTPLQIITVTQEQYNSNMKVSVADTVRIEVR